MFILQVIITVVLALCVVLLTIGILALLRDARAMMRARPSPDGQRWEYEPMPGKKPREPVQFLHDASDEEMEIRKQPYLKRVLDAIRGKDT